MPRFLVSPSFIFKADCYDPNLISLRVQTRTREYILLRMPGMQLIELCNSVTSEKLWFKQLGNSKRKLLPEQYKKIFRNKQIVSMEYEGLHPDQEREIFQVRIRQSLSVIIILI